MSGEVRVTGCMMDLEEYYRDQYNQRILQLLEKFQKGEKSSPLKRLVERKHRAQDLESLLQVEKEVFHIGMQGFARRWKELHVKASMLQEEGDRFQEKEAKQKEAARVSREMRRDIQRTQEECEQWRKKSRKVREQLLPYETLLHGVMDMSGEISDIISHVHTLVDTCHYLTWDVLEAQRVQETQKEHLITFIRDKSRKIQELIHHLDHLQIRMTEARRQSGEWESRSVWTQRESVEENRLGSMKLAVLSLFQRVRRQSSYVEEVVDSDSIRQLEGIQRHVRELTDIYKEVKTRHDTEDTQGEEPAPGLPHEPHATD